MSGHQKQSPRIASRLQGFDSKIFQEVFKKQRTLKNPIDLSIGTPEGATPEHVKQAGIKAIENNRTIYTPSNGIPELRAAISRKLARDNSIQIDPNDISIVPGLTTGLLLVYQALLNPGDEVIIMDPSYPPYIHLAALAEARAVQVPTLPNFQLDLAAIEKSITPKTRLILINSPNNPTGAVYPKKDLVKLAKLAEKHNVMLVSDEMYENFLYEGEHFSVGSIYPNTITMNGFSKSYAMTGWRMGYIAGPAVIIQAINQLLQYVVFSSSSIAQHAALEAIKHPPALHESYPKKRDAIRKSLQEAGYEIHGSDGAYYTFFEVPNGMIDMEFIDRAADRNVLLLPGRAFSKLETFVRLSYGGSIEDVKKGLAIITDITRQVRSA